MQFINKINSIKPGPGEVAIFFIAQAGFCIKTSSGKKIFIDPYLSDAAERLFGFKRMIPAVITAEAVDADLYLVTHHHIDHLDEDSMPVISRNQNTIFVTAPDCAFLLNALKVPEDRYHIVKENDQLMLGGIQIKAIYADHGELAPEAIGFLIEVDGIKIYHAGDTALRPDEILSSLGTQPHIMIAPINGQYGNMNASEAIDLAIRVQPEIIIPCHYWMFLEHVSANGLGDPATFLKEASRLPEATHAKVMAPGEFFIYTLKGNKL